MVLAAGLAPALATPSTSSLFCWTTRSERSGASRQCRSGRACLQDKHAGCRKEAKWSGNPRVWGRRAWQAVALCEGCSQSPVLPWAELAYETCLSAGSIARWWRIINGRRPSENRHKTIDEFGRFGIVPSAISGSLGVGLAPWKQAIKPLWRWAMRP